MFSVMTSPTSDASWVSRLLGDQQFQSQKGFFPWWYRLTAPPEPENPTLRQRDLARRSKILSALALFLGLTLLMVAYLALTGPNKQIITTVYILYPTLLLCLLLNRRGQVTLAGCLFIVSLVGGMYLTLVTTSLHGGIAPNDKDILYLPVFGELVAAALLPTYSIFLVAGVNICFSLWVVLYAHHTTALTALLATSAPSILFRVIEQHFFVTLVLWIMASWTLIAIKRADRATEIARLEHTVNAAALEKVQEKARLDASLAEIVSVHMRVANGDGEARVPVAGDNVLWQIAVPLNNLLARYHQAKKAADERDLYLQVLTRLVQEHPDIREQATSWLRDHRTKAAPLLQSPKA